MTAADFRVVVNDEDQYSIWPSDHPAPPGWHDAGFTGTRQSCLTHIDAHWTDMRPRTLRQAMDTATTADH